MENAAMKIPGLDRIVADVSAIKNAEQSAVKLLQSIPEMIRNAMADDGVDPEDATTLANVADGLESSTAELAAAVVANTPAAPEVAATGAAAAS